jgi:8-oxo-dGTP pyrophosphatase MutT (NUDIX family)
VLAPGHPQLDATPDLAAARATVAAYHPASGGQADVRDRLLAFVDRYPDALLRTCAPGHLTGSAAVVDPAGPAVLLTLHRKLGRWLQLGGHCDGDGNLAGTALREAVEESGIPDLRVVPEPVDLDIHAVPCPPGIEGWHLDVRFAVVAPPGARPVVGSESIDLAWFPLGRLPSGIDTGLHRLLAAASAVIGVGGSAG